MLAWEQTLAGCPLQKLILEIWITPSIAKVAKDFANPLADYPKAFMVDYFQHLVTTYDSTPQSLSSDRRKRVLQECRLRLDVTK
jgi:hypothetical protein